MRASTVKLFKISGVNHIEHLFFVVATCVWISGQSLNVQEGFATDPVANGRFTQIMAGTESTFQWDPQSQFLRCFLDVDADAASYSSTPFAPLTDHDTFSFSVRFTVESFDDRASPTAFIGLLTSRHVENFGDGLTLNLAASGGQLTANANIDNAGWKGTNNTTIFLQTGEEYVAYGRYSADQRLFKIDVFGGSNFVTHAGSSTNLFPVERSFSVDRLGIQNGGARTQDSTVGGIAVRVDDLSTPGKPPISITPGNATATETSGAVIFPVNLSLPSDVAVSFDYSTESGTAVGDVDFQSSFGTIIVPPGSTFATVVIPVFSDLLGETNETLYIRLSNATNSILVTNRVAGTILDADIPSIRTARINVLENVANGQIDIPVSLSNPSALPVSVSYQTRDGTAVAGQDYFSKSGTLVFDPGTTQSVAGLTIRNDDIFEGNESFRIEFSNPKNAVLATNQMEVTIIDDDPIPFVSVAPASVLEGQSTGIGINLSRPSAQVITVHYSTISGTATSGIDYSAISGTATFLPGQTNFSTALITIADSDAEPDEYLDVVLDGAKGALIGEGTARVVIVDDDTIPAMQVLDARDLEGAQGQSSVLQFPVKLSRAVSNIVQVSFFTAGGTATAGLDFESSSGTLEFLPGETNKSIGVRITGDNQTEANETFNLILTNLMNATMLRGAATGTILNDDGVFLRIDNTSVLEADGIDVFANFTVTLLGSPTEAVSVGYFTRDSSAVQGQDYRATNGVITFATGQTTRIISIPVIGDTDDEPDEQFEVQLTGAIGATLLLSRDFALGTIVDNDPAVININSLLKIPEGTTNASIARFTVSLTSPSPDEAQVQFFTMDDTATAGADYAPTNGVVVFPPGATNRFVDVVILPDSIHESDETFFVHLTNAINAKIKIEKGVGKIIDDDDAPEVRIGSIIVGECVNGMSEATATISLSEASGQIVRVTYSTRDITATAGEDYIGVTNAVVEFPPGSTEQQIIVHLICDGNDEPTEGFGIDLGGVDGGFIGGGGGGNGSVTIIDNDPPEIRVSDTQTVEGNRGLTNCVFSVSLSSVPDQPVAVNFATADINAAAGLDYAPISGTLIFNYGETNKVISVPVIGDELPEGNEAFRLVLSNPVNSTVLTGSATGIILDDDLPELRMSDSTVIEGDVGESQAAMVLTLSQLPVIPVSVTVVTREGTAKAGVDFRPVTNVITFAPGQISNLFMVPIEGDTITEGPETVFVRLQSPTNAYLDRNEAILTIVDNDGSPVISAADVTTSEGDAQSRVTIVFSLSKASSVPVSFFLSTTNGSAAALKDYFPLNGTIVSFSPGQTNKTQQITILGDRIFEGDEDFWLLLSNPTGGFLGREQVRVLIQEDDDAPRVSINDASLVEGRAGTSTNVVFQVRLSQASSQPITMSWETVSGTAFAGSDFVATNGILVFPPGTTNQTIQVTVLGDNETEADEAFTVLLTNVNGALIGRGSGVATIVNDDGIPLQIFDASIIEPDQGQLALDFTVRLGRAVSETVTVFYETIDGTASSSVDYLYSSNKLTFPPGITEQAARVFVRGDILDEPDETFFVRIFNATNATIIRPVATGTIIDNDPPVVDIDDQVINAGIVPSTQAVFQVTLTTPSKEIVSVHYATANGTATSGTDYNQLSGTLSFSPGETNKLIIVPVNGNSLDEGSENFYLDLSLPVNAVPGKVRGIATILNDRSIPPEVRISSPADGSQSVAGVPVTITAIASDADGLVTRVIFYSDNAQLGIGNNSPWQITWSNPPAGGHTLRAIAFDNAALSGTSPPVRLNITASNQPPVIGDINVAEILEDHFLAALPVSVSDDHTLLDALGVTITSSDPSLVPNSSLQFIRSGTNVVLSAMPATNQFGSCTIFLTIRDSDGLESRRDFRLNVLPVNDPPTGVFPTELRFGQGTSPQRIRISDISPGPSNEVQTLTFRVSAQDKALLSGLGFDYANQSGEGFLLLTPQSAGATTVTVLMQDNGGNANGGIDSSTNAISVVITATNQPPLIGIIPDQSGIEDHSAGPISLQITDDRTAPERLKVFAASSNPALIPATNLSFTFSSGEYNLAATPLPDQFGSAQVTVTAVDEEGLRSQRTFSLSIQPVNDQPDFSVPPEIRLAEDFGEERIRIDGIIAGPPNETQKLQLSGTSSKTELLSSLNVEYSSPSPGGFLVLHSASNAFGNAMITVKVQDDGGTANGGVDSISRTINLLISPVNDLPSISSVADQNWTIGAIPAALEFSVVDIETPADALRVAAISSGQNVVPESSIHLSGSGLKRTLTINPAPQKAGRTVITLSVEDADGGRAQTSFAADVSTASTNRAPTVRIVQPVDRTVFPFGVTASVHIEAEAQDDGAVRKVEFFIGSTKLGEALSAPWSADWENPDIGDYVVTAVATDDAGATGSASVRVAVAEVCGTVALICNPADSEMSTLLDYLFEIGIRPDLIDRTQMAPSALNDYDLIIWHDFSNQPVSAAEITALADAARLDRAIYFIGDDLPSKVAALTIEEQNEWTSLIHLLAAGNASAPASRMQLADLALSDPLYFILKEGKSGTVADFDYPFGVRVWKAPLLDGEFVLGTGGDSVVLVGSEDLAAGGTARKLSQTFRTFSGADDLSIEQRRILFKNAVWWLMRCVPCSNLNLSPAVEQNAGGPDEWIYSLTIEHDGRCEAVGVSLSASISPGLTFLNAVTEKGLWQTNRGDLNFNIGRLAAGTTLALQFSVRASTPGSYTNNFFLRSSSENGGALADNAFSIVTVVPGLKLQMLDRTRLQVTGFPYDARYSIEESTDLRIWSTSESNHLEQGTSTIEILKSASNRRFLRAKAIE